MPRFKDQAICIRLIDWSETSQIVALLTREHGLVRGLAKGSKRMSPGSVARFSGGIELLSGGEVVGVIKPSSDLATLTEWDLQEPYFHLRNDLEAQRLAYYAADLCHALLPAHDAHPRVFAALGRLLGELADAKGREPALLRFQWELLDDCGYRPELLRDVHTGAELPAGRAAYQFDALAGGFSERVTGAPAGDHHGPGPWRVRRETMETLRRLADPSSAAPTGNPQSIARANRLLCVYIRAILDRELPTMPMLLERGGDEAG